MTAGTWIGLIALMLAAHSQPQTVASPTGPPPPAANPADLYQLDMTKVASGHYRVGRWQFDPVYGPDRPGVPGYGPVDEGALGIQRLSIIVGWWSNYNDEDAGIVGADYAAVIYVRSAKDWPAALGPLPDGAESSAGWLRAYWPTGTEFYVTVEGLAEGAGGDALRNSEFWSRVRQHKLADDNPVVSTVGVGRDPIAEAALHPSTPRPYEDRAPGERGPPIWHPSGIPCRGATPPRLTEAVMFQKLMYVFETVKSGSPSVADPDPCALSCPGEVLLAYRPASPTFVGQRKDEDGRDICVYQQGPQYVFCCGGGSVRTWTTQRQFAWVGECPPASSLPTSPFELRRPPAGSPSFCPRPPDSSPTLPASNTAVPGNK